MKSRSTSPPFLLAILPLVAGCSWLGLGGDPTSPLAILRGAGARLPEAHFADLKLVEGGRLYDYMDGAAEAYFARNFRRLGVADAQWRKIDAKIEVYQVASPADAKALFDDQNDGKGRELPAGLASAAWDARELEGIFHRGPYFCHIIIYGSDKAAHQLLDTLAAAIDQSLPAPDTSAE